jgi:hypothetical protein
VLAGAAPPPAPRPRRRPRRDAQPRRRQRRALRTPRRLARRRRARPRHRPRPPPGRDRRGEREEAEGARVYGLRSPRARLNPDKITRCRYGTPR